MGSSAFFFFVFFFFFSFFCSSFFFSFFSVFSFFRFLFSFLCIFRARHKVPPLEVSKNVILGPLRHHFPQSFWALVFFGGSGVSGLPPSFLFFFFVFFFFVSFLFSVFPFFFFRFYAFLRPLSGSPLVGPQKCHFRGV